MFDLGQVSRQDERIQDSSANAVGALLAYPALLTTLGELARVSPAHGLQPYA